MAIFICLSAVFAIGLLLICAGVISIGLLGRPRTEQGKFVVIRNEFEESVTATPSRAASLPTLVPNVATIGIMVENHVDARPQSGLDSAALVYEAPAEGGISRYLAVFSYGRLPEKIGPVRSVRPYYIDWAEEWGAVLLHSGGSPDALARLKRSALVNLDEISYNGRYFWRDNARVRPHNLFTSGELVVQAFADYQLPTTSEAVRWPSVGEWPIDQRPADYPAVRVKTLDADYCVGYRYEQADNRYERWLGGLPHRTADGTQLYAKSVVVQGISGQVLDREGRLQLSTDAGGQAWVLSNGQSQAGRWERKQSKTTWYDDRGRAIGFPDGSIWITLALDFDAVQVFPPTTTIATPDAFGCK